MLVDPTRHVLFVKRSSKGDHAGEWAFPGGGCNPGETKAECARRETREETGHNLADDGSLEELCRFPGEVDYTTYRAYCDNRFNPELNDEHTEHRWAPWGQWPSPLHPGVEQALDLANIGADAEFNENEHARGEGGEFTASGAVTDKHGKKYDVEHRLDPSGRSEYNVMDPDNPNNGHGGHVAGATLRADKSAISAVLTRPEYQRKGVATGLYNFIEKHHDIKLNPNRALTDEGSKFWMNRKPAADMALDRASVREKDADGRLHVEVSNISKAAINEYMGHEIPDFEKLRLDPNHRYKLFRDPAEIAKAVGTFNNLPVLSKHVPVSAVNYQPDLVIGSTGTDAAFVAPYLRNSLVIWAKPAIDAIESGEQKELSSAYRYVAEMTPGNYEGQSYDGVMTQLIGNHVALVRAGRAGADVAIGDSLLSQDREWATLERALLQLEEAA